MNRARLKVVLVGQKWLGEQVLLQCVSIPEVEVVSAIAPSPDDRLAKAATLWGIPVSGPVADTTLARPALNRVQGWQIPAGTDLIACAHAHAYISREARAAARLGAIGYHPSLLPLFPGKDAIEQTLAAGQKVTGGTVFSLDDGYDTGPALDLDWCFVQPDDTPASLWRRDLAPMGLDLLTRRIRTLALNHAESTAPGRIGGAGRPPITSRHAPLAPRS
jgi:methionyl-tRNA formyltransferase